MLNIGNKIILNKKNIYFIEKKFFILKKGKIVAKCILENGKIIAHENCIKSNEFIGNFFLFLPKNIFFIPKFEIEIEALEDNTVLEEINISFLESSADSPIKKILLQFIRSTYIRYFQHLYDTKGYILSILMLYADTNKKILKKLINHEIFNISRSSFYATYSELKKENFITEKNKIIYLNSNKIDTYLKSFCT